MSIDSLSPGVRRVLALSLLVGALALSGLMAIGPFLKNAALQEDVAALRTLLAQHERLALATAGRPTNPTGQEMLLVGETTGIAGAELQRVVVELARQHAMSFRSTQVAPPTREEDLTVIALETSLQGRIEGLRGLLHAVETGAPMLFVEGLSIKPIGTPAAQQPTSLDVNLRVRGYAASKDAN